MFNEAAFRMASVIEEIAMKLDHIIVSGALVQAIDILRNERESGHEFGETRKRKVAWVRLGCSDQFTAPAIPLPDQFRIFFERLRGRELLRIVFFPEPVLGITKGGYATFGRYACARQYADVTRIPECRDKIGVDQNRGRTGVFAKNLKTGVEPRFSPETSARLELFFPKTSVRPRLIRNLGSTPVIREAIFYAASCRRT